MTYLNNKTKLFTVIVIEQRHTCMANESNFVTKFKSFTKVILKKNVGNTVF